MSRERETLITDLSINAVDGFFYITQKLQAEIRELLTQPDINTQYLLDQVARLTVENAMLKEKWLAPPTREPLSDDEIMILGKQNLCNEANSFKPFGFARAIEKAHGIGGEE